jgi:hypothetical protein
LAAEAVVVAQVVTKVWELVVVLEVFFPQRFLPHKVFIQYLSVEAELGLLAPVVREQMDKTLQPLG